MRSEDNMKYIFCDLETTGTNPEKHGIIQLSGIVEVNGEVVDEFNYKIQPFPGQMISPEALTVNGITVEQIKTFTKPAVVYGEFIAMLGKHVDKFNKKDKFFLVGYNSGAFDDPFLRQFFVNNEDTYYGSWFWWPTIDIAPFASEFLKEHRSSFPDFKLSTVAKAIGIEVGGDLHDAMYDAKLVRSVYKKLILGE